MRLRNGAEAGMINRLLLGCSLVANFILLAKVRKKTETLNGYLESEIQELKQKSMELERESKLSMTNYTPYMGMYMGQSSLRDYFYV